MKKPSEKELQRIMTGLKVTKEEALQIWKEDEGIETNEEQEALVQKTKGQKLDLGAKSEKTIEKVKNGKKREPPKRKANETKKQIIQWLFQKLNEQKVTPQITNDEKYIEFDLNGEHYTISLIQKRKKKEV